MKKLWIIVIAIIAAAGIAGGGTYYYFNQKAIDDKQTQQTQIDNLNSRILTLNRQLAAATATVTAPATSAIALVDETAGWKTYSIRDLNLSFKFPADWGNASLSIDGPDATVDETGTTTRILFSNKGSAPTNFLMGYASKDFSAGRGGASYESAAVHPLSYNDCASFKKSSGYNASTFTACEDVITNSKTVGFVLSQNGPEGDIVEGQYTMGYYFTGITNYPVIGLQIHDYSVSLMKEFVNLLRSMTATS